MSAFILYNPATHPASSLVSALLSTAPGISIDTGSIDLAYGTGDTFSSDGISNTTSVAFYDGTISGLGIGSGLLLT